jgi:hypothetical protein
VRESERKMAAGPEASPAAPAGPEPTAEELARIPEIVREWRLQKGQLAAFAEIFRLAPYPIGSAEQLRLAMEDLAVLYDIIMGKRKLTALLELLRERAVPEVFYGNVADVAVWLKPRLEALAPLDPDNETARLVAAFVARLDVWVEHQKLIERRVLVSLRVEEIIKRLAAERGIFDGPKFDALRAEVNAAVRDAGSALALAEQGDFQAVERIAAERFAQEPAPRVN